MADPQEEFRALLRPAYWSPVRAQRVLAALQRRRRRGTLSTVAAGSALVAVTLSLAIMWFAQGRSESQGSSDRSLVAPTKQETLSAPAALEPSADSQARAQEPGAHLASEGPKPAIRLDDGSKVLTMGQSKVRLLATSATETSIELESGQAWFDVKPSSTRTVEVRIADVRVRVLGTEFVVEEKDDEVFVWVQRGSASVTSNGEVVHLGADERGRFRAHESAKASALAPRVARDSEASANVKREKMSLARMSVSQLWSLADEARIEGRQADAIDALDMLIKKYPSDARVTLAAFTLGRVLVTAEESPRRAAAAFEKARILAPHAPLAEDALAREIEALRKAGTAEKARARSALYERLYPQGRHTERVRKQR